MLNINCGEGVFRLDFLVTGIDAMRDILAGRDIFLPESCVLEDVNGADIRFVTSPTQVQGYRSVWRNSHNMVKHWPVLVPIDARAWVGSLYQRLPQNYGLAPFATQISIDYDTYRI